MISIVCIYNNEDILNNYLLKSLNKLKLNHELIFIDNSKNKFKSAAKALNYGGKKAKEKYIMFIHQDVDLNTDNWLEITEKLLNSLPNLGIAGVAGKSEYEKEIITNLKHGNPPHYAGKIQIQNPEEVQTLDDCLLLIPKTVFNTHKFDEKTGYGWHLYGVDYCLTIKMFDLNVYVLPTSVNHKSSGDPFSNEYYNALSKLLKKHRNNYKIIHTTIFDWNTRYPIIFQKIKFYLDRKIYSGLKNRLIQNKISKKS